MYMVHSVDQLNDADFDRVGETASNSLPDVVIEHVCDHQMVD
jgi:4-hydroxy-3-methylbut-2-enyl diphosphate reductase IspH